MAVKTYKVGGAVRDELLDYPWHDTDWVVTGSSPEDMLKQGYTPVGKDFPVFLHPKTKEEYALARTERKSALGYQGFTFNTNPNITIEEDLSRRDLTINAIAQDKQGLLVDPYNGQADIHNRVLRHVSDAFQEDPVRVLRLARFKARYHHLGFSIADETKALIKTMKDSGELNALVPERVWQEMRKALAERHPEQFFYALKECQVLDTLFPHIFNLFGVPQTAKYHPEIDTGVHVLMALHKTVELNFDSETLLDTQFAVLMHDLGKAITPADILPSHHGHEQKGLKLVKAFCQQWRIPKETARIAQLTCQYHTHIHRALELKPATLVDTFYQCDAFRKPLQFTCLLQACLCDWQGRLHFEQEPYPQKSYVEAMLRHCNSVNTKEIIGQGFKGKEIKEQIRLVQISLVKQHKKAFKTM